VNLPTRLFAGIALGAVTNTSLFAIVAASRLLYGMARAGDLPSALARVSGRGSPVVAVVTVGVSTAVLAATGAVGALATTAVNALLFVLCIVNLSAIRTRHLPGGWRPPGWVAYAGAVATGGLVVFQLVTASAGDLVRLGVLLAMGAALRLLNRG
jgi:amino acid transporter